MNTQEILNKIQQLKDAIESTDDADTQKIFQKKLASFEAQIAESEKKIEKEEKKIEAEEKKELSSVETKIGQLKEAIDATDDPDIKSRFQKKLKELQDSVKGVKEEIKEEKKEVAEQKKDIKEAIKKVKTATTKSVRKTAIKKVKEVVTEVKKTTINKKKRQTKLKGIMSQIDALINRNKKLKEKYSKSYKKSGKTTDIERDAKRSAKPFGYRFVGKYDYRVPTEIQIKRGLKRGTIDYESRPNRSDYYPEKKVKLADGGMMMSGGMMAKGGRTKDEIIADKRLKALKPGKRTSESGNTYHESRPNRSDVSRKDRLEDGGMMAKGGKVGYSAEDKARKAKPAGWRWKEEAVTKKIIERKQLSMQPSKKMRDKYPDLVYYEDRLNKSDKNPSSKYQSV